MIPVQAAIGGKIVAEGQKVQKRRVNKNSWWRCNCRKRKLLKNKKEQRSTFGKVEIQEAFVGSEN